MKPLFPFIHTNSLAIVLLLPCLFSCKKFTDVPPPENMLTGETVFSSDQTALSALSGLYTAMMQFGNTLFNGDITIYPGLSSDELTRNYRSQTYDAFLNNAVPVTNDVVGGMWSNAYKFIYQANAVLEGLDRSAGVSTTTRVQIKGEVKVVRALCYFYLVNLFGGVPLVTATDYNVNETLERTSADSVYRQVIADLQEAQTLLGTDYPNSVSYPGTRIRPNRFTATALLSRVYLYRHDYADALSQADAVINSGFYSLEPDLNSVFLNTSREAIWQLLPLSAYISTSEGNNFVPFDQIDPPIFSLTDALSAAFDSTDRRKIAWTKTYMAAGQWFTIPYKYKIGFKPAAEPSTEYNMVLRLAELYLIRAEARTHQDDIAGAQEDLNVIRSRAGLNATPAATRESLLQAVAQERQAELFAEWGHRWFDLKRTGQADSVLGRLKGSRWQPTDTLYPVPRYEVRSNPNLRQNPGY